MRLINSIKAVNNLYLGLFKPYRAKMAFLAALGFVNGFLDGLGITLLIPLLVKLVGGATEETNFLYEYTETIFAVLSIPFTFQSLAILFISIFIVKAVVLYVFGYVRTIILADFKLSVRSELYADALGTNYSYLAKQKLGHLDNVLVTDTDQSSRLLENSIGIVLALTSMAMYVVIAFAISILVSAITLAAGLAVLILFKPIAVRIRDAARELTTLRKDISHSIGQGLTGMKTIKALNVENQVLGKSKILFKKYRRAEIRLRLWKLLSKVAIEPFSIIYILLVFAFSFKYLSFEIVAFIPIIYMIQRIFIHTQRIQSAINVINQTLPFAFALQQSIKEADKNPEENNGLEPFIFNKSIQFKNVDFSFGKDWAGLSGMNFNIEKGSSVGIFGHSGSGKTTIVDLILRLQNLNSGSILLDGQKIDQYDLSSWRKNIVYVSQEPYLINDTVMNNIKFYNQSISDEEAISAAKKANIYDVINSLPERFDTNVGERGNRLSGGEKQRIVLARALARAPKVLILDEATSALDSESEKLIKETLKNLKDEITQVIIAHKPSFLDWTDKVLVVEAGNVLEKSYNDIT